MEAHFGSLKKLENFISPSRLFPKCVNGQILINWMRKIVIYNAIIDQW